MKSRKCSDKQNGTGDKRREENIRDEDEGKKMRLAVNRADQQIWSRVASDKT